MAKSVQAGKTPGFPRELFDQLTQALLDYFKAYTVAHPPLSQAGKAVWSALREPAGALLLFVFGPTGVGKTTLLAHIEQRLIEQALPQMLQNQSHQALIEKLVDVPTPAGPTPRELEAQRQGETKVIPIKNVRRTRSKQNAP